MNIFWICLLIVSVQSKKDKNSYPDEEYKLRVVKVKNYTLEWGGDKCK